MSESEPARVLYMEDDRLQALLAKKELQRAGYLTELAHWKAEGLAKYTRRAFDVLVLGCMMPERHPP